jgi:hypothetical protein
MLRILHCLDNRLTVNCEILATCSSTYYWVSGLRPSSGILSKGSNWVGALFPSPEGGDRSSFRTMDKVQKPSNSDSEVFTTMRIFFYVTNESKWIHLFTYKNILYLSLRNGLHSSQSCVIWHWRGAFLCATRHFRKYDLSYEFQPRLLTSHFRKICG